MAKENKIRFVSRRQRERLEQWTRRKPVFVLMGEFSAGKSTLMNFLLRRQTLPTQVTATQLPPVWFSWGRRPAYVQRHDGSKQPIELDQLDQIGVNDAQFIRIYLEADILEAVDLIDTPGISDPNISSDVWQRAVGQANGVLWCTHATQAWRETERAMWVSLPERLQQNSLLLITRADALGTKDRQKVLRRVNRETGSLFSRSILFSARDAITARDKTCDADLWVRSGGGKVIDSFLEITENIMNHRTDLLARYQVDPGITSPRREIPADNLEATFSESPYQPEAQDTAAPLKLLNPLTEDGTSTGDAGSVQSFPVRPSRVSPRNSDAADRADRRRIDAEEAEKLRAKVNPEPIVEENSGVTEESLRAFFRDSSEIHETADPADSVVQGMSGEPVAIGDPAEIPDDLSSFDLDQSGHEEATPEFTDISELASSAAISEGESLAEPGESGHDVEGAEILSISRLVRDAATQSEGDSASEGSAALQDALTSSDGSLLSASQMWKAVVESGDLPETREELLEVFKLFLEEFDQIAAEHLTSGETAPDQDTRQDGELNEAGWRVL